MGSYDVPAMIETVKQHSSQNKVTYIGYSQGSAQMLYALAKFGDDFFKYTLDRFIAIGPCLLSHTDNLPVEAVQGWYEASMAAGVYTINGPDAEGDLKRICDFAGEDSSLCHFYK